MQKNSLIDVWLASKFTSGIRNNHRCSVEKAVLKNFVMFTGKHLCWSLFLTKLQAFLPHSDWTRVSLCIRISPYPIWMREKNWTSLIYVHSKSKLIENIYNLQEWHQNTKFFISYKTFTVGKITKTCQEQPNLVSGHLIQVFL